MGSGERPQFSQLAFAQDEICTVQKYTSKLKDKSKIYEYMCKQDKQMVQEIKTRSNVQPAGRPIIGNRDAAQDKT